MSIGSSNNTNNTATEASAGSQTPAAAEFQDCLSCRLVGAGALLGVAGYALHARSELDPLRFAARRRGLLGLGLAFAGVAAYRLGM